MGDVRARLWPATGALSTLAATSVRARARCSSAVRRPTNAARVPDTSSVRWPCRSSSEHGDEHFRLVLDMRDLTYLNSAGLRILADFLTISRANGGDLHLAGLSDKIRRVFEIIGFDNFFDIFEDIPSAIEGF
jgi:anti-anti-sigma factor